MWAKLMFIAWQHFIFSSANDSATHETPQAGFSIDVSTFLSENSSTTFNSTTPLITSLQGATAHSAKVGRNSEDGTATYPASFILDQTFASSTRRSTSTVPPNHSATNLNFQNSTAPNVTTAPTTIDPNATYSITVTSYSPNVTNSSVEEEITTNSTDSLMVTSTAQPTSLTSLAGNTSFTSQETTSFTTSIESTTVNVSTTSFIPPVVSTTLVSSSSITTLLSKNHSTTSMERGNTFAAPSKTGTTLIAAVCLILVAAAFLGVVMYLKKRRVFYSRLQEENPIGSWSNYNNPVYEDS